VDTRWGFGPKCDARNQTRADEHNKRGKNRNRDIPQSKRVRLPYMPSMRGWRQADDAGIGNCRQLYSRKKRRPIPIQSAFSFFPGRARTAFILVVFAQTNLQSVHSNRVVNFCQSLSSIFVDWICVQRVVKSGAESRASVRVLKALWAFVAKPSQTFDWTSFYVNHKLKSLKAVCEIS
jgi:hypothetical protein